MQIGVLPPGEPGVFRSLLLPEAADALARGEALTALGLTENGLALGAAAGYLENSQFQLISLYVAPAYRQRGGGRMLVDALLELLPLESPQAAKVMHSRAIARTTARIFLSFIQIPPGFQSIKFCEPAAPCWVTIDSQCGNYTPLAHILQLPIKKNSNLLNIPFCEKCMLYAQINPFFPKILQLCNLFPRAAALFFPLFPSVFHKSPLHGHSSFPLVFAIFCLLLCETLFVPVLWTAAGAGSIPGGQALSKATPFRGSQW